MKITKEMVDRGVRALAFLKYSTPDEKKLQTFIDHMRPVYEEEIRAVLEAATSER